MYRLIRTGLACLLLSLVFFSPLQAKTLFGVVSERSAADLAAGAAAFSKRYPGHRLLLRSTSQVYSMDDATLQTLIKQSDVLLSAGIFGDIVPRLEKSLSAAGDARPFIALSSDSRLKKQSLKTVTQHVQESAQSFWSARGAQNVTNLFALAFRTGGLDITVDRVVPASPVKYFLNGAETDPAGLALSKDQPWIAILDHETGDRLGDMDLTTEICTAAREKNFDCLASLAQWGPPGISALEKLRELSKTLRPAAIIMLQDFVVGGGKGRENATALFKALNIPVIKGLKIIERNRQNWELSEDGLPWNSLHYRIAMPELQGASQPHVLATAAPTETDPLTGLEISFLKPLPGEVRQMMHRISNWQMMRQKKNASKRLAIIYYNHPPGRHNIGADNLNVPESLFELLHRLKKEGYKTGPLPATPEELLSMIQERAINLPEDDAALAEMSAKARTLTPARYREWFATLPEALQKEMVSGPLFYLHSQLKNAIEAGEIALGRKLLNRIVSDIHHVLEGADHPARGRAADLLDQLNRLYSDILNRKSQDWGTAESLLTALKRTGIEGLRGWGDIPGNVMVHDGTIVLPGIEFGNIFIGPQPPRGWELNEELLHANMSFPPTHQYLAFYFWLKNDFRPDALIHLGRHSTYEFLPRHGSGVGPDDYSYIIAGDIPGLYPYIVDGVGEGIQAKRRGLAVIVDHLTPPLSATPLYDDLLQLRQFIETYEASNSEGGTPTRVRALEAIRKLIDKLNLKQELEASMAEELKIRGISFEEADGEFLIHEVGHYLTHMQEDFMPLGLHVFGRNWTEDSISLMADSMSQGKPDMKAGYADLLRRSPNAEMTALLNGLDGGFIAPGKGNDPIRSPDALPTGRNFHALDNSLLPTKLGHELGVELAGKARDTAKTEDKPENSREAVILWASDTVRDEGAIIAFGFDLLGITPTWTSRGILNGIKRLDLEKGRGRRDTVFITSGLFRDLYGQQLVWLDKAVLMALDGASDTIREEYPELVPVLEGALAPLGGLQHPGKETLKTNQVARNWVKDALSSLKQGLTAEEIALTAHQRIFGTAPGAYGAGINRLVERSGSWEARGELAEAYIARMGHNYGVQNRGASSHKQFRNNLKNIDNIYLGRASNLYGLMDNNDAFDYLGGLSMAVEMEAGKVPQGHIIEHANPHDARMEKLDVALLSELRGRFLNPAWLKPLMNEGYAGARTMGSSFLEYLWGWQVTNPDIVKSWAWDEVKDVYLDDRYKIGLDKFLEQGDNVHVKANMLAIMLVAAEREYWQTDEETLTELSRKFADLVLENGLPGSGHTSPDHPIYDWIKPRLTAEQQHKLDELMDRVKGPRKADTSAPVVTSIAEIQQTPETADQQRQMKDITQQAEKRESSYVQWLLLLAGGVIILLLVIGIKRGASSLPTHRKGR